VIHPDQPVAVVGDPGTEVEVRVRLARIGFDNVVGALSEPMKVFQAHPEVVERSSRLTVEELARRLSVVPDLTLVDVRNPGEVAAGAITGSVNIPLSTLARRMDELEPGRPTVVYCAGGYRSSVAASALVAAGFADVSDLVGGFSAWATAVSEGRAS
jgi:rhodanese-related sulfurtransferase